MTSFSRPCAAQVMRELLNWRRPCRAAGAPGGAANARRGGGAAPRSSGLAAARRQVAAATRGRAARTAARPTISTGAGVWGEGGIQWGAGVGGGQGFGCRQAAWPAHSPIAAVHAPPAAYPRASEWCPTLPATWWAAGRAQRGESCWTSPPPRRWVRGGALGGRTGVPGGRRGAGRRARPTHSPPPHRFTERRLLVDALPPPVKPGIGPPPRSELLGRLQQFLPEMESANAALAAAPPGSAVMDAPLSAVASTECVVPLAGCTVCVVCWRAHTQGEG